MVQLHIKLYPVDPEDTGSLKEHSQMCGNKCSQRRAAETNKERKTGRNKDFD